MVFAALVEVHGPSEHDRLVGLLMEPWAPVRALWGTDRASKAATRAMMNLAGGPAPTRDPSKVRPTRGGSIPP